MDGATGQGSPAAQRAVWCNRGSGPDRGCHIRPPGGRAGLGDPPAGLTPSSATKPSCWRITEAGAGAAQGKALLRARPVARRSPGPLVAQPPRSGRSGGPARSQTAGLGGGANGGNWAGITHITPRRVAKGWPPCRAISSKLAIHQSRPARSAPGPGVRGPQPSARWPRRLRGHPWRRN